MESLAFAKTIIKQLNEVYNINIKEVNSTTIDIAADDGVNKFNSIVDINKESITFNLPTNVLLIKKKVAETLAEISQPYIAPWNIRIEFYTQNDKLIDTKIKVLMRLLQLYKVPIKYNKEE